MNTVYNDFNVSKDVVILHINNNSVKITKELITTDAVTLEDLGKDFSNFTLEGNELKGVIYKDIVGDTCTLYIVTDTDIIKVSFLADATSLKITKRTNVGLYTVYRNLKNVI